MVVRAPWLSRHATIERVVQQRATWIYSKRHHMLKHATLHASQPCFTHNAPYLFMGKEYQLNIRKVDKQTDVATVLEGDRMIISTLHDVPAAIQQQLEVWLKQRAHDYCQHMLEVMSKKLPWVEGVPPLKLGKMKRQWGSCSASGRISINYLLMQTPQACINYVILHELCHLQEMNHSSRFYALLDTYEPDWKEARAELKRLAPIILDR